MRFTVNELENKLLELDNDLGKKANIYYLLAIEYEREHRYSDAVSCYLLAVECGNMDSDLYFRLGFEYQIEPVPINSESFPDLTDVSPRAITILALQYLSGIGKTRSVALALDLLKHAADADDPAALNLLFYVFHQSCQFEEVFYQYVKGLDIQDLERVAKSEYPLAYGNYLREYLKRAVELGYPLACSNYLHELLCGESTTQKLSPIAQIRFKEMLKQKHPHALSIMKEYSSDISSQYPEFLDFHNLQEGDADPISAKVQAQQKPVEDREELTNVLQGHAELISNAMEKGELLTFLSDVVDQYGKYAVEFGGKVYCGPFFECSCPEGDCFNRFMNTRRQKIENRIVADLTTRDVPKDKPLTYLSLGAGGYLQDLFILTKLILAGYRTIQVFLVDPTFYETLFPQFEDVLSSLSEAPGISITVEHHLSVSVFHEQHPEVNIDLLLAIDFGDFMEALDALVLSHQQLSDNGRFFLSMGEADYIFDRKTCLYQKTHFSQSSARQKCVYAMQQDCKIKTTPENCQSKKLRYMSLSPNFHWTEWSKTIPELMRNGFESATITLLQPTSGRKQYDKPETIAYIIALFAGMQDRITVNAIDEIDDVFSVEQPETYHVLALIHYRGGDNTTMEKELSLLRRIRDTFPNAEQCYAIHLENLEGLWQYQRTSLPVVYHLNLPSSCTKQNFIETLLLNDSSGEDDSSSKDPQLKRQAKDLQKISDTKRYSQDGLELSNQSSNRQVQNPMLELGLFSSSSEREKSDAKSCFQNNP